MTQHGGRDLTITGEVAAVVFRNDGTGFGVIELTGAGPAEGARAAGPLADLVEGQPVRLTGRWRTHERYGPTFETVAYEIAAPRTTAGLIAFLASPRFPGVGKTTAARIVETFGLGVADVLTSAPERLSEVKGVSATLADGIATAWREAGALPQLVATLTAAGIPASAVTALHRRHGAEAADLVGRDPYVVLDLPGVRWAHAEALARAGGVTPGDPRRLSAAVRAALLAERDGGHTVADTDHLRDAVARLAGVDAVDARHGMDTARRHGHVCCDEMDGRSLWALADEAEHERILAGELVRLVTAPRPAAPRPAAPPPTSPEAANPRAIASDADLTPAQRRAVEALFTTGVSVLTGGPGTGKTRTIRAVVAACVSADLWVALCAPTGRAAKRLEELTGQSATTVHRLLEAQPARYDEDDAGFTFSYGRDRRLPHDVVVMDECSMADTGLVRALVEAVGDGGRLLLVGDSDQLPSVGPGAVLRDVLALTEDTMPRVHLDVIHRQAARSRIVTMAHDIRAGALQTPQGRQGDVFAVPQPPPGLAGRIAEIVAVRAPSYFEVPSSEVQVLAPMYRGPGGVDRLNAVIGERLNPPAGRPAVAGFREGDRVVQTRNDAELDVANGEVGEVAAVLPAVGRLEVAFPSGLVSFTAAQARHLRPAWCLTVHKSQGGEWPVVVLALDPSHRSMLYRELVYTAVTRARRGLLLVGDPALVSAAARRSGSGLVDRHTGLVPRVRSLLGDAAAAPGGSPHVDASAVPTGGGR